MESKSWFVYELYNRMRKLELFAPNSFDMKLSESVYTQYLNHMKSLNRELRLKTILEKLKKN